MSPRPYRLGKRQAVIDKGRRRILDAARALLREVTSYPDFTVDAVARRADVARATLYYQFRSKAGLLEAVCDDLAEAGGMADLAHVFNEPDPRAALHGFIDAFGRFWAVDRLVMRRLRALAALDPDVQAAIAARDQRRRAGLAILASRMPGRAGAAPEDTIRVLHALTSFETFDCLAGADGDLMDVVPLVAAQADATLGAIGDGPDLSAAGRRPQV